MAHNIGEQNPVDVMFPIPRGMGLNACTISVSIMRFQGGLSKQLSSVLSSRRCGVLFSYGALYKTHQSLELVA